MLALDTVLSAMFFFAGEWTPDLKRSAARDLLRFLLCRLYDQGRGELVPARVVLAQGTLAHKLGLSRVWVGELCGRLRDAGWIDYHAPVLADGMRGPCVFGAGRLLKRLLVMLARARRRKRRGPTPDKEAWQFSRSAEEKQVLRIQEREQTPPSSTVLQKMPLLGTWMERGT